MDLHLRETLLFYGYDFYSSVECDGVGLSFGYGVGYIGGVCFDSYLRGRNPFRDNQVGDCLCAFLGKDAISAGVTLFAGVS